MISGTTSATNTYLSSAATQHAHGRQRPSATDIAAVLFSQLDTDKQGYIEKSDLESALSQISSSSSSGPSSTSLSADEMFTALDGDGNGKVTQDELASALQSLSDQLDSQFNSMRMSNALAAAGNGTDMPPPPPPPESSDDAGFTKDQLTSMVSETSSTDSNRSNFMSDIVQNFDAADTNKDGKVSLMEAQAYTQSQPSSASTTSSNSSSVTQQSQQDESMKVLKQVMDLMNAYAGSSFRQDFTITSTISIEA